MLRPLARLALCLVLMFHVGAALFLLAQNHHAAGWWACAVVAVVAAAGTWRTLTGRKVARSQGRRPSASG